MATFHAVIDPEDHDMCSCHHHTTCDLGKMIQPDVVLKGTSDMMAISERVKGT